MDSETQMVPKTESLSPPSRMVVTLLAAIQLKENFKGGEKRRQESRGRRRARAEMGGAFREYISKAERIRKKKREAEEREKRKKTEAERATQRRRDRETE